MNEVVAKQGAPSITGTVYGFFSDANFKYLDVQITAGHLGSIRQRCWCN